MIGPKGFALAVSSVAALFSASPVLAAMTPQLMPHNTDGSSRIADPDEALESMSERRSRAGNGIVRTYSDSSSEVRDLVRLHASSPGDISPR